MFVRLESDERDVIDVRDVSTAGRASIHRA
jgi:hypothetical protein